MTPHVDVLPTQAPPVRSRALVYMLAALAIIPINTGVFFLMGTLPSFSKLLTPILGVFTVLALAQFVCGIIAVVLGIKEYRATRARRGVWSAIAGGLAALAAPAGWAAGALIALIGNSGGMGGAWGRPLRVRGRQLHPELREGSDWTDGDRPDPSGLDPATRLALEALWLHDAQKEHASVPAFARISWLLAAVGAPADLTAWAHRAALEEIAHTRLCFALAAGYGGRSHSVEPMPELVVGGGAVGAERDPLVTLAVESLTDGCQLEDFNADVAAACARVCQEPVTRSVLERIAREERSHADFSWALLGWLVGRHGPRVEPALRQALATIGRYPRPTAVGGDKVALVAAAEPALLRRHGRLPDAEGAAAWDARLQVTREKTERLVGSAAPRAKPSRAAGHVAEQSRG
jgi:hypothetical protein